ncbi:MAG: DUF1294 domain-containing protein [Phycisphaerales bacterium]
MPWLRIILAWAALASVAAFVAYWSDKRRARAGRRRIRERTLHLLSLAGGWPGACIAQRLLRHKTRDARFLVVYWATVALHLLAWGAVAWLSLRPSP